MINDMFSSHFGYLYMIIFFIVIFSVHLASLFRATHPAKNQRNKENSYYNLPYRTNSRLSGLAAEWYGDNMLQKLWKHGLNSGIRYRKSESRSNEDHVISQKGHRKFNSRWQWHSNYRYTSYKQSVKISFCLH